jgi:DNA topoisomerase-2
MSATKTDRAGVELRTRLRNGRVLGCGSKTPRERILLQPQDYISSVEKCTRKMWVFEGRSMTHRVVTYVPSLYKIFDEILVYAASMDSLNVEIDATECRISIHHSGQGVPIERHPEDDVYIPEMVFSDLSNCEEIAGGRNSYAVKLANLFSTEFIIQTVDSHVEKEYMQVTHYLRSKNITKIFVAVNFFCNFDHSSYSKCYCEHKK